jgi:hypothetical protein
MVTQDHHDILKACAEQGHDVAPDERHTIEHQSTFRAMAQTTARPGGQQQRTHPFGAALRGLWFGTDKHRGIVDLSPPPSPSKKKAPSSWTKGPNTAGVTGQLRLS